MSEYILYGTKMIENDDTMKDFAESIIGNIQIDDLKELCKDNDFEDKLNEAVWEHLTDDISRTDIDYEQLMYKYRGELGDLLYNMENHGYELEYYPLHFYGEATEKCFNTLMTEYISLSRTER